MKQFAMLLLVTLALMTSPAHATEMIPIAHQQQVQVGPYTLMVGFSRWPLNADRSLDITFTPQDGIQGKSGTVTLVSQSGVEEQLPLVRHPRMREVWGLDVIALSEQGPWSMVFHIDGPQGPGSGRLAPIMLAERPGPALWLSWGIGLLPVLALCGLLAVAWVRTRPGLRADAWNWT